MWVLPHIPIWLFLHSGNWPSTSGDDCPRHFTAIPHIYREWSYDYKNMTSWSDTGLAPRCNYKVPCPNSLASGRDEIPLHVLVENITVSDSRLAWVLKKANSLPALTTIYKLMHNGWVATCRQMPRKAHKYWDMRDELISDNGLLLKGYRIIPPVLRESFLQDLHKEQTLPSASWQPEH